MTPTLPDTLRRIRARIDTPEKWCKKFYAVDRDGSSVSLDSPKACRWCLSGAIMAELPPRRIRPAVEDELRAWCYISLTLGDGKTESLASWQDLPETTHGDVMQLLDRCIARAEREGVHV